MYNGLGYVTDPETLVAGEQYARSVNEMAGFGQMPMAPAAAAAPPAATVPPHTHGKGWIVGCLAAFGLGWVAGAVSYHYYTKLRSY